LGGNFWAGGVNFLKEVSFNVKLIDFGLAVYLPPGMVEILSREFLGGNFGREGSGNFGRDQFLGRISAASGLIRLFRRNDE
jgi:hypothetical protein